MNYNFKAMVAHLQTEPAIATLIMLIFFYFTRTVFAKSIGKFICSLVYRQHPQSQERLLSILKKPLSVLWVITGFYVGGMFLLHSSEMMAFKPYLTVALRVALLIISTWVLCRLAAEDSVVVEHISKNWPAEHLLIPVLTKIFRFVVMALGILMVAAELGYDANGFIAGLGLGGLAIALAAQDLLANLFAGFVILAENSFKPGDWISNADVEGTVESINWRSTRIRTFDNAQATVPNSLFTKGTLVNWSKRHKRLFAFLLGLNYKTTEEQLKKTVADIQMMLQKHEHIDQEEITVDFENFGESGLNINIHCYTKATGYVEHQNIKNDVNFKIASILTKNGVEAAFPGKILHLEDASGNYRQEELNREDNI